MKNIGKFDDMEILTLDDLELESPNEGEKKKKRKYRKIRKAAIGGSVIVFLLFLMILFTFFFMRWRREQKLKTDVEETVTETGRDKGHYILHNGKEYRYKEDVVNILCLGIDKDIPIEEKRTEASLGLADAVLLASIDTAADTVKILSIPRDTLVPVKRIRQNGEEAYTGDRFSVNRQVERMGQMWYDKRHILKGMEGGFPYVVRLLSKVFYLQKSEKMAGKPEYFL